MSFPFLSGFALSGTSPPTGGQTNPNANITIGLVSIDDNLSKFVPTSGIVPNDFKSVFTDYYITNRYENPQHRYMMGITSPGGFSGQSTAFVQLTNQTLLWITNWTALKWDQMPTIPNPAPQQSGWVLLSKHYELPMVVPNPVDGETAGYRINGVYVYGAKNPNAEVLNDTRFPRPPWLEETAFDRTPSASGIFDATLLEPRAIIEQTYFVGP